MKLSRDEILDHYYKEVYEKYLFGKSLQSAGIRYFERALEKNWGPTVALQNILEVGAGNGEHFGFVREFPTVSYTALDLREISVDLSKMDLTSDFKKVIRFVKGDVHALEFSEDYFDRVLSTCLFHHLQDPLQALYELRRVTRDGGQIRIAMPTDPGFLNQMVKRIISFPRLSKLSKYDPKLIYALEHRNHIVGLLTLIETVFAEDDLIFEYYPNRIKSWNLNLLVVASIKVRKN